MPLGPAFWGALLFLAVVSGVVRQSTPPSLPFLPPQFHAKLRVEIGYEYEREPMLFLVMV
jgi:hypothetical protein